MPLTTAPTCRHLISEGHHCGRPALRRLRYCYSHQCAHKRNARKQAERARQRWFESLDMNDAKTVQRALAEIIDRLASRRIDHDKAGAILLKLQTASLALRNETSTTRGCNLIVILSKRSLRSQRTGRAGCPALVTSFPTGWVNPKQSPAPFQPRPCDNSSCPQSHPETSTIQQAGARKNPMLMLKASHIILAIFLSLSAMAFAASDCLPIGEARQHVGENKCVTGKVLRVKAGARGVHFVDFCEDQMSCPFTVVVFGSDLKDVGDVRRLAGRTIEIHGPVKLYNGRAEIILKSIHQLTGGSTLIPPLPKEYDVEKQGHYSAGNIRPTKKPAKTYGTISPSATYGNEADVEDSH